MTNEYPPEAYAPNGILWWELVIAPGKKKQKFGVEQKLAAWLRFNKKVGETFTTKEGRVALGEPTGGPNDDEHFQRRLRQLRDDGWVIPSQKYDSSLSSEQYRVDKIGWYPGSGVDRPKRKTISAKLKRLAHERDGYCCMLCGARGGEPRVDNPDKKVVLTAGHVLSNNYGGAAVIQNIRTECSECNEPARSDYAKPESPEEVATAVRGLVKADRLRLAQWVIAERHIRDKTDEVYDRYRMLAPGDKEIAKAEILKIAGLSPNQPTQL